MMRLALISLAAWPTFAAAQKTIVLSKPDAEFAEPFSIVSGVRPLRDGRVLVSDSREHTVQLIEFSGRTVKVGSEGRGPGEYLLPNAIVALPGDTSALWDGGNRRYLLIHPDATVGKDFRLEPPEGMSSAGYGAFAPTLPRGVDALGNIYFQGSPFVRGAGGLAPADSVPVIRFDRARQRVDTVAYVRPAKGNATVTAGPGGVGVSVSNGRANPLVPLDDWGALPDGRIAVVRGEAYRVDFYVARAVKTVGPPAPFEQVSVDNGVKQVITEQRKRQLASGTPRSSPTGQVSTMPPELLKQFMNLEPWPAYLPPFLREAVIVRPAGDASQVWVLRTNRRETDPPLYDVFDGAGRLVARVQLPVRTTVVAFGPGALYALRTDDDDLQYLQRYRLPVF